MLRSRTAVAVVLSMLLAVVTTAGAAAGSPVARHAKTTYSTLTVSITTTSGTTWGKVSIAPLKKTCSAIKCTYKHVKVGTKLTFTETPTDNNTWPFDVWTVNKTAGTAPVTTLKTKMAKNLNINASYLDAPNGIGSLSISITYTGTLWGTVKIAPLGWVCASPTCNYSAVPLQQSLTLTEKPTNFRTWPFCGWTLNNNNEGTNPQLQFTQAQTDTVALDYGNGSC